MMNKGRGRPRGGSDARERILAAARARFAGQGYGGTTMRAVAADADVDVALVSYHFGSKQGLFAAAMALALSPGQILRSAMDGDPAALPDRILTTVLKTWDDPRNAEPLTALLEAAQQDEQLRRAFAEYVEREVVHRLADHLGGPRATERAAAVVTVVIGLVFSRWVLRLTPLADADPEAVHRVLRAAITAAAVPPRPPTARAAGITRGALARDHRS
jgi:AcrR family transcriptional regulator